MTGSASMPEAFTSRLTVREAAYVARAPESRIQRAIERGQLPAKTHHKGRLTVRLIALEPLLGYAVEQRVAPYVSLGQGGRNAIRAALHPLAVEFASAASESTRSVSDSIQVGPVKLDIGAVIADVIAELRAVLESRAKVVCDPEIRGGEPVVRGTRVPVYRLAELKAQGVSDDVLLADHPSLTREHLAAALLYARLHPRRGRPVRATPWHGSRPEVLLPATAESPLLEEAWG